MLTLCAGMLPLTLGDDDIPLAAMVIGGVIALVAIVTSMITSITTTRAREQTRREVAAYVAEGSITPQDAERILAAGRSAKKACENS